MLLQKQRKNNAGAKPGRFLITINVVGSSGPIRFVVNEDDVVAGIIDTALKSYAREGRLPLLGSDANNFLLYCANSESDALSPWEPIGGSRGRNFVLCKKQIQPQMSKGGTEMISDKRSASWKAWLNKSLNFKISSH